MINTNSSSELTGAIRAIGKLGIKGGEAAHRTSLPPVVPRNHSSGLKNAPVTLDLKLNLDSSRIDYSSLGKPNGHVYFLIANKDSHTMHIIPFAEYQEVVEHLGYIPARADSTHQGTFHVEGDKMVFGTIDDLVPMDARNAIKSADLIDAAFRPNSRPIKDVEVAYSD